MGIIVILAVFLVYAKAIRFPYVRYDDFLNIVGNPVFQNPTLEGLLSGWSLQSNVFSVYMPLTHSLWWSIAASVPTPFQSEVFHLLNITLHAANSVLVYLIVARLTKNRDKFAALIGALVFALHPLQVESTAWVSGTNVPLFSLFALLSIWFALSSRRTISIAFYVLSLLAKPNGIVVPFLIAILEWSYLGQSWKLVFRRLGLALLLGIPVVAITQMAQSQEAPAAVALWMRPLVAFDSVGFYLSKVMMPVRLGIDYGHSSISAIYLLLSALAATAALMLRKKMSWPLSALLVFLVAAGPSLGLISFRFQHLSNVADRYVYLSMLAVAWAMAECVSLVRSEKVRLWFIVPVLALAMLSFQQCKVWSRVEGPHARAVEVNPKSLVGHMGMSEHAMATGNLPLAEHHLKQGILVRPEAVQIWINLSAVLLNQGKNEQAKRWLEKALTLDPKNPDLHFNLDLAVSALSRQ